eukprot:1240292-Rhodomonas_salina.1
MSPPQATREVTWYQTQAKRGERPNTHRLSQETPSRLRGSHGAIRDRVGFRQKERIGIEGGSEGTQRDGRKRRKVEGRRVHVAGDRDAVTQ